MDWKYWGKPIPAFGDKNAELVIIGLAPAAHGANRTGRIFTGDRSGDWLFRALHKAGFANQAACTSKDDGLKLSNAIITCTVKCAPPLNKPEKEEIANCAPYLEDELKALKKAKVYLVLGGIGLNGVWPFVKSEGEKKPKFGHNNCVTLASGKHLLMSYHPSQQNTFTKRLTEPMFDRVFKKANQLLA